MILTLICYIKTDTTVAFAVQFAGGARISCCQQSQGLPSLAKLNTKQTLVAPYSNTTGTGYTQPHLPLNAKGVATPNYNYVRVYIVPNVTTFVYNIVASYI